MSYQIVNGYCALSDVKAALGLTDTVDDDRISLAIDAASRLIESTVERRFWLDPLPRTDAGCVLTSGSATVQDSAILATDVGRSVVDPTGDGPVQATAIVADVVPGVSFQMQTYIGVPLPATGNATQSLTIGLVPKRFTALDQRLTETDDIATMDGVIVQTDFAGDGSFGTTWEPADWQNEPASGIMGGLLGWPTTQIRAIRSMYFPVWGGIAYPSPYTQYLVQITARWGWLAVPSPINQAVIIQAISTYKAVDVPFGATAFPETGILRLKTALHPAAAILVEPYGDAEILIA